MSTLPAKRRAKGRELDRKTLLMEALRQMPLLPGEDGASYEDMLARVIADVDPKDAFEEFWVEDIVHNAWDARLLRRCLRELQRTTAVQQLKALLESRVGSEPGKALIDAWQRGEVSAIREIETHLGALGTTMQAVTTIAVASEMEAAYDIDRLIACKEVRRNNAGRELDRHREALAARVRRALEKIDDAEFKTLPPSPNTEPVIGDERLKRYANP